MPKDRRKDFRNRKKPIGVEGRIPWWMRDLKNKTHKVGFLGSLNVSVLSVIPSEARELDLRTRLAPHDPLLLPDLPRTMVSITDQMTTVVLHLTAMRPDELAGLKMLLEEAITLSEPVVEQLQKEVDHAHENGLGVHARGYRTAPILVDRSRHES